MDAMKQMGCVCVCAAAARCWRAPAGACSAAAAALLRCSSGASVASCLWADDYNAPGRYLNLVINNFIKSRENICGKLSCDLSSSLARVFAFAPCALLCQFLRSSCFDWIVHNSYHQQQRRSLRLVKWILSLVSLVLGKLQSLVAFSMSLRLYYEHSRFALIAADASNARSILVFKQDEDKVEVFFSNLWLIWYINNLFYGSF